MNATGTERLRVGLFFGGPPGEHQVSCASALAVIRALPPERYDVVAVGVTLDGDYTLVPEAVLVRLRDRAPGPRPGADRIEVLGPEVEVRPARPRGRALITLAGVPAKVLAELDVVFPVLHGRFGEDGVLQGLLDSIGVPYVGCGVLASAIGMDKVATKRALVAEGIPITPHVWFDQARWAAEADPLRLVQDLRRPLFVKPASMGSSIGVSRVRRDEDLAAAVREAFEYDPVVIVEQGVTGRELECGVLGGARPETSVVGEVTVTAGCFDYRQKYLADKDPMTVPAALDPGLTARVRGMAVRAFRAIGGWGLARVDFLYDEFADRLYVNELNTMPGFTAHSMYPKVWAASGVPYPDLVAHLIELAFERHARRPRP